MVGQRAIERRWLRGPILIYTEPAAYPYTFQASNQSSPLSLISGPYLWRYGWRVYLGP